MNTMKTLVRSALALAMCLACSAQDTKKVEMLKIEVPRIVVTNLSDKLQTEVTIDNATGIDIRRLNLDSMHADKHKSRFTTVKDMSIDSVDVRKVVMAKPVLVKGNADSFNVASNLYIDSMSVKRLAGDNITIKSLSTVDMLVADLSPALYVVDGASIDVLDAASLDAPYAAIDLASNVSSIFKAS